MWVVLIIQTEHRVACFKMKMNEILQRLFPHFKWCENILHKKKKVSNAFTIETMHIYSNLYNLFDTGKIIWQHNLHLHRLRECKMIGLCKASLFIHVAWFKTREIRIRRMNVALVCSILLLRSNLHYKQITEENVKWLASWEYFITSDHEIIALMFLTIHQHKYTYTYLSWKGLKHNIIFHSFHFSLTSKENNSHKQNLIDGCILDIAIIISFAKPHILISYHRSNVIFYNIMQLVSMYSIHRLKILLILYIGRYYEYTLVKTHIQ